MKRRLQTVCIPQIAAIEPNSAAIALPAELPAAFGDRERRLPAVITEIDGAPLDFFARDEEALTRIAAIAPGKTFELILHPADLVKAWKAELRAMLSPPLLRHE